MDRCDIPFHVGGFLHSQDPPFQISKGNFEGEIDELRISNTMRYPVADQLSIIRSSLPEAGLHVPYSAELAVDAAAGEIRWQVVDGCLPVGLTLDHMTSVISGTTTGTAGPREFTIAAADSVAAKARSLRTNHRYEKPMAMDTTPGTKYALRQPDASIRKPDTSAALATPILPKTPFTASTTPVFVRP